MSRYRIHTAHRTIAVVSASAAFVAASSALADRPDRPDPHPGRYSFQTVDVPFGVPGVDFVMQIVWANNSGVITVQYQSPPGPEFLENMHTAVLRNGEWTVIDVFGADTTGGTNANSSGQVVLSFNNDFPGGAWQVATHGRNGLKPFPDIPGYPAGVTAQGVNDRGQIAAVVGDVDGVWHGFFGDGEDYTVFDYPDPDVVYTQANMLNNAGVGVGTYVLADGSWHAFKWEDGEICNIDPEVGSDPSATSINNCGVIAGVFVNPDGLTAGYVQCGDEFEEFTVPDATYTVPYFINDRGQIAGVYGDADGTAHGFVATPRRLH